MAAKRVLVTGAAGSPGVNFIQSLRAAPEPFEIVATDINEYHLQWLEVEAKYLVPPCDDPDYIDILNHIITKEEIEFVHPQPDVEVQAVSKNRYAIKAKTHLPAQSTIDTLQDKHAAGDAWREAGLRSRPTVLVNDRESLMEALFVLGLPFWMRATTGAGARGSTLVSNIEVAYHWLMYWRARGSIWEFIAEEYLPGRDYAWQSLWEDGRLITSQGRERIEYIYPFLAPSGRTGTPIVARTVSNDAVNDIAQRCVLAIDPKATGVFSVDLREDRFGNPIPTEINCGRFFTTSYFFTKAGLNMPYLYVKQAYGESVPDLPRVNALEPDLYWIRHIDCPTVLVRGEDLACVNYSTKPSLPMTA